MNTCKNCKYLKEGYDAIECHCYKVQCTFKTEKGKNISWACDLAFGGETGKERVRYNRPYWCPLKKEGK